MIAKSLLAGALLLALDPQPILVESPLSLPEVKQVFCANARGTAFKIAPHKYLSVYHVTSKPECKLDGQPIHVTYEDPIGDFSIVSIYDPTPGGIPIDCNGYQEGGVYHAVGFARGELRSVSIPLRAVDYPGLPGAMRGWSMFIGVEYLIPGMSGGPILNERGQVVGTVNAYNALYGLSWSRPLSETVLCQ